MSTTDESAHMLAAVASMATTWYRVADGDDPVGPEAIAGVCHERGDDDGGGVLQQRDRARLGDPAALEGGTR